VGDIHSLWVTYAAFPDGKTLLSIMVLEALHCSLFGCQTHMHGGTTVGLQWIFFSFLLFFLSSRLEFHTCLFQKLNVSFHFMFASILVLILLIAICFAFHFFLSYFFFSISSINIFFHLIFVFDLILILILLIVIFFYSFLDFFIFQFSPSLFSFI